MRFLIFYIQNFTLVIMNKKHLLTIASTTYPRMISGKCLQILDRQYKTYIMKKHVLTCVIAFALMLFGSVRLQADAVSPEQAKQIASQFINQRSALGAPSSQRHAPSQSAMTVSTVFDVVDNAGQAYLYAVQTGSNGFVLVSGDERFNAVLGYSAHGTYDEQTMPENMREWVHGYIEEMQHLEAAGYQPAVRRTQAAKATIGPLVTTTWNQGTPYNNACPVDGTEHSATGCVATAMAQIINYHMHLSDQSKRPTQIIAEIPAYTTNTWHFQMNAIAADTYLPNPTDLLDNYTGGETNDQKAAVANLMLYCGVSMGMDYTAGGSGVAGAPDNALKTYFGFDPTTRFVRRGNYTYQGWMDLIYDELAAGRPVYHSGAKAAGGHAFVVDGYQDGLFHINWGWGGHCNDYFALSAMDPDDTGMIGAATSSDGYTIDQQAVIGIQKGSGETYTEPIVMTLNNLRVEGTKVLFSAWNMTSETHDFEFGIGFIDGEGNITPISTYHHNQAISPNSGWDNFDRTVPTNPTLAGQTKKIVPISRLFNQQIWYTNLNPDIHYWSAVYDANGVPTLTVHPQVSLAGTLSVPSDKYVNDAQTVQLEVTNSGDEFYGQIFLFASTDPNNKGTYATQLGLIAPAGNTTVQFIWTPTATGTYYLWAATDDAGNNVIANGSETITEDPCKTGKHIMFVDYHFDNEVEGSHQVNGCNHTIDVVGPDLTGRISFKNIGAAINENFLFTIAFDDGEDHGSQLPPDIGLKGYTLFSAGAIGTLPISFTTTGNNALTAGKTYRIRLERLTLDANYYVTNRENLDDRYYVRLLGPMMTLTPPTAKTDISYTGSAQALVNAGSSSEGTIEYSLNGTDWSAAIPTGTNAGSYTVYYHGIANGIAHSNNPGGSVTVTIAKAASSVSVAPEAVTGLIYNGQQQTLITSGTAVGGTMHYSLDNEAWSTDVPTAVEGGLYTVYYKVVGDANHEDHAGSSVNVRINYTVTYNLDGGNWTFAVGLVTDYNEQTATFTLLTPYRSYHDFLGWTGSNGATPQTDVTVTTGTTGNLTYTANWAIHEYTITWLMDDDSQIDQTVSTWPNKPTHDDPVKPEDEQYTYTFAGWTPEIMITHEDATYTATFTPNLRSYKITWMSDLGAEYGYEYFNYGATPTHDDPVKEADANYTYTFAGWSPAITSVTGDATYTATFNATPLYADVTANEDPEHPGTFYSTYYDETKKHELPSGVEAYVADLSGNDMLLTKIAGAGEVIPADVAVILKANSTSITLHESDATPVSFTANNDLLGTDVSMPAPAHCYVLSGHSSDNTVQGVGFYQFSGNLKAHKAYLVLNNPSSAPKRLRFVFNNENTTTGIETPSLQGSSGEATKVIENGVLYIIRDGVRYDAQGKVVE